jgi:hypothetical protein
MHQYNLKVQGSQCRAPSILTGLGCWTPNHVNNLKMLGSLLLPFPASHPCFLAKGAELPPSSWSCVPICQHLDSPWVLGFRHMDYLGCWACSFRTALGCWALDI